MKTVFARNTGTRESAESSDILIFWPFKGWFRDFLYTTQLKSLEMLYGQDPQLFAHGPSRTCGVQDPLPTSTKGIYNKTVRGRGKRHFFAG